MVFYMLTHKPLQSWKEELRTVDCYTLISTLAWYLSVFKMCNPAFSELVCPILSNSTPFKVTRPLWLMLNSVWVYSSHPILYQ